MRVSSLRARTSLNILRRYSTRIGAIRARSLWQERSEEEMKAGRKETKEGAPAAGKFESLHEMQCARLTELAVAGTVYNNRSRMTLIAGVNFEAESEHCSTCSAI